MGERKTSKELVAEWIELYRKGYPGTEIGRMYGFTNSTVFSRLRKAGCEIRSVGIIARSPSRLAKWQRWVDLYATGKTLVEVAEEVGVHPATVRKTFMKIGVPRRKSTGRPAHYKPRLRDFRNHRDAYRMAQRIERMMAIVSRRKGWAA